MTAVVDGDTVRLRAAEAGPVLPVEEEVRVRLLEIDAPETQHPIRGVECFGAEATAWVEELLTPGTTVLALPDVEPRDRFDRELLYLWLEDGTFVNESLIRSGHAVAVLYEPNDRYIDRLRAAEADARAEGAGLWSACPEQTASGAPSPSRTPAPSPTATAPVTPGREGCDPAYPGVCIPPSPPDLDCADVPFRRFEVLPPDPHRFDGGGDGVGCEAR